MMKNYINKSIQAERELQVAQGDFDRQQEITKLLLEGVSSTQVRFIFVI